MTLKNSPVNDVIYLLKIIKLYYLDTCITGEFNAVYKHLVLVGLVFDYLIYVNSKYNVFTC